MGTLKEAAKAYVPEKPLTVADLDQLDLNLTILTKTAKNKEGKDYNYDYVVVEEEEYRVPKSVKRKIQDILEIKPECAFVKVGAKGAGMQTEYTVVAL